MCIIIFKPQGMELPADDIIKTSMDNNPDGAGYMFNCGGNGHGVKISKGYWNHEDLILSLLGDLESNNVTARDVDIIIHARIATQGLVKPENCHPFPISGAVGDLQALDGIYPAGLVHNGIIDITDAELKNLSDTQLFILKIISRLDFDNLRDVEKTMLEIIIGTGKLIILDGTGAAFTFGTFITDAGILYSNETYKAAAYTYYSGKWSGYGYHGAGMGWEDCSLYDRDLLIDDKAADDKKKHDAGTCDLCGDWFPRLTLYQNYLCLCKACLKEQKKKKLSKVWSISTGAVE